jgi:hypothetical protein
VASVHSLAGRALQVLERNDTALFVKPGPRVHPFQWNSDSVPHIVFHDAGDRAEGA